VPNVRQGEVFWLSLFPTTIRRHWRDTYNAYLQAAVL
jgi:hypothetical protein